MFPLRSGQILYKPFYIPIYNVRVSTSAYIPLLLLPVFHFCLNKYEMITRCSFTFDIFYTSSLTNDVEHSMYLFVTINPFMKYLFNFLPIFKFILLWTCYEYFLHSLNTNSSSNIFVTILPSLWLIFFLECVLKISFHEVWFWIFFYNVYLLYLI